MSKLLMFDFECSRCGVTFEDLVRSNVRGLPCECGGTAWRVISGTHLDYASMATHGEGMETAIDKFDRAHRERKAIDEKHYANHGDYGKMPGAD